MINAKVGAADKGSRYSLQYYMKSEDRRKVLSDLVISASPSMLSFLKQNLSIDWKSPLPLPDALPHEKFYEYKDIFRKMGINKSVELLDRIIMVYPLGIG